ncbi:uncharacterized protein ColSpa_12270 [Colletotrichum spaethianum]|uniref:Uncharacterized protein n=1 Tax=Colletotrichum spaethianum TaxID=700344 RepID=A0AA37PH74_9PEZI|nr:uncharacterized protein ColSpa_12270 [Colletotrichum spaethianum]GKT52089.1 hypothetical protein ColSpa_12270 [Colletotrichum spaethianum]
MELVQVQGNLLRFHNATLQIGSIREMPSVNTYSNGIKFVHIRPNISNEDRSDGPVGGPELQVHSDGFNKDIGLAPTTS